MAPVAVSRVALGHPSQPDTCTQPLPTRGSTPPALQFTRPTSHTLQGQETSSCPQEESHSTLPANQRGSPPDRLSGTCRTAPHPRKGTPHLSDPVALNRRRGHTSPTLSPSSHSGCLHWTESPRVR